MGLRDKQWTTALTISAAAAGISLVAYKVYRRGSRGKQTLYSLQYAGSRGSLPALYEHTLSPVYSKAGGSPKVYCIGGHGTSAEHLEVWVLDSALNKWTEILPASTHDTGASVFVKRFRHAAAGVGNAIYVFGGYTSKTMGDVLKFDTEKEQWSTPSFIGQLPSPRSAHTATVVGKKVVVFGGSGEESSLNDVHILDTVTNTWTSPTVIGLPPSPRCFHSAVLLNEERIVIYGGYTSTAESDIWFLEVDTPYVKAQRESLGKEVVAWSKGVLGNSPQPVVICGPSGVGKGTLIGKLMKDFPTEFGFSVSHTTRQPRNMERAGVHYHFTERPMMEAAIKEGKFLESADVHGNLYGTSILAVEAVADAGKRCILDIDVQGAELVKKSTLNALFIFISPPSFQELEARLRGRGTETEDQIQKRLKNAKIEMDRSTDTTLFDHLVINDNIDVAYEQLKKIMGLDNAATSNGCHKREELQPDGRSGHSSSVVNSKVLVYGGLTDGGRTTNEMLILDTSKLTNGAPGTTRGLAWSSAVPKCDARKYLYLSPTLSPRYNHRVVSLSPTEILLSGGFDGKQALNDSVILKVDERL
ncbi:guanylate kinase [Marchantia polymorpha subsp. ruderalis]